MLNRRLQKRKEARKPFKFGQLEVWELAVEYRRVKKEMEERFCMKQRKEDYEEAEGSYFSRSCGSSTNSKGDLV